MTVDPKKNFALHLLEVLETNGFEARLAGGCVRDQLMGKTPGDYDIATTATPDEVQQVFDRQEYKSIPTGVDHGTMTVVYKGVPFEITTLRIDFETDGRRAQVKFGTSFEEDAARRDFTFNAMFEDRQGLVYDFFDGKVDLQSQRLRFVGDSRIRIAEDYLRILRLFRFWSRLECVPDKDTLEAVKECAHGLAQISQERVIAELLKFAEGPAANAAGTKMDELGITVALFNGATPVTDPDLRALIFGGPVDLRFCKWICSMYPDRPLQELRKVLTDLRLANTERDFILRVRGLVDEVKGATDHQLQDSCYMDWIDMLERDEPLSTSHLEDLCLWGRSIYPGDHWSRLLLTEEKSGHLRRTKLPVDGAKLMKTFGLDSGREVGELLFQLKSSFRNGEWQTVEQGLAWAGRKRGQPKD